MAMVAMGPEEEGSMRGEATVETGDEREELRRAISVLRSAFVC